MTAVQGAPPTFATTTPRPLPTPEMVGRNDVCRVGGAFRTAVYGPHPIPTTGGYVGAGIFVYGYFTGVI